MRRQRLCTVKALHVADMAQHHSNGRLADSRNAGQKVRIAFQLRMASDVVFNFALYLFDLNLQPFHMLPEIFRQFQIRGDDASLFSVFLL